MANEAITAAQVTLALLDELTELADATFLELDANIFERTEKMKAVKAVFAAARKPVEADGADEDDTESTPKRKKKAA